MRKVLLLLSALALAIAPTTAASASSAYRISIHITNQDIDVSRGHSGATSRIYGSVSGGTVKGKTVHLYATNIHAPRPVRTHIKDLTLGSSGSYSYRWHPPRGGRWIVEAVKPGTSSRAGATAHHHLDAYQWDFLGDFYDGGALNLPSPDTNLVGHQPEGLRSWQKEQTTPNGSDKGRYNDAYWVMSGGWLIVDPTGNRCKGVTFHIGVSVQVDANGKGMYDVPNKNAYRYTVYKGDVPVISHTMHQGDPVYDMGGSGSAKQKDRKSFGEQVPDGLLKIVVDPVPDGDPKVRFVIGSPKIACTYPSDNIG